MGINIMTEYPRKSDTVYSSLTQNTVSCVVTEERNGQNELVLKYLANAAFAERIQIGCVIECPVNNGTDELVAKVQHFDIYEVKRGKTYITAYARHIFYRTEGIIVKPFHQQGVVDPADGIRYYYLWDCVNALFNNAITDLLGFSFGGLTAWANNVRKTEPYSVDKPTNLKSALFDIIAFYGGELCADNFTIKCAANRGKGRGSIAKYGLNVTKFNYNENLDGAYNMAVPYVVADYHYVYNNLNMHEKRFVFPTSISKNSDAIRKNIIPYLTDVSSLIPPYTGVVNYNNSEVQRLLDNLQIRINNELSDVGSITAKVSLVDVLNSTEADSGEFDDVKPLAICDEVLVDYRPYKDSYHAGLNLTMKVVKTVFEATRERYNAIELGTVPKSLSNVIDDLKKETGVEKAQYGLSDFARFDNQMESSSAGIEAAKQSASKAYSETLIAVKYTEQSLTAANRKQANANIHSVTYDGAQGLTGSQKLEARKNIGAVGTWQEVAAAIYATNDSSGSDLDNYTTPGYYELWGKYYYSETVDGVTTTKSGDFYGGFEVKTFHGYVIQELASVSSTNDSYTKRARRRRANGKWGRFRKQTWELA